ncbi:MAG: ATP-dependent DNA helicase RecQ, partial [Myxococcales bacterium]|nr:ATP-dependent DNA helicase RecQ [Myxococcales bacterium]
MTQQRLRSIFGFDSFRPGQQAVIGALQAGRPALAIFPTGGGKSLCYQLPALDFPGLTLVISPLIALMKDQTDQLQKLGIAAAKLDSSLSRDEAFAIYDAMAQGTLKLLYVAPERLGNEGFRARLRRTHLSMIAIDEAHCISQWGHNFRPDYLKIAAFAQELGVRRVLALTATATPSVSADIRAAFDIDASDHIQTGFYRPNLTLRVHRTTPAQRTAALIERIKASPEGATIVYVTLQKTAATVAAALCDAGLNAQAYHAGLDSEVRSRLQEAFMGGDVPIMVATIAFGMGIDKADIRAVYHYNLPKSLESYSQEIGRAGRDGKPSRCELFAVSADKLVLDNFSYGDTPTAASLQSITAELLGGEQAFSVSRYHLSKDHDMRPLVVNTVLTYLELAGIIESTGPHYTGYKVQFTTTMQDVIGRYSGPRRDFVEAVFAAGKMGRIWLTIEPEAVAEALQQPVSRVRSVLTYSEQQGHLITKPSGLRYGYRRLKDTPQEEVTALLVQRFFEREQSDIARTSGV